MNLDTETRRALLGHARRALVAAANGNPLPPLPDSLDRPDLEEHGGVFVTLKADGRLRGCIGHFGGDETLGDLVARMTRESALRDPRFPAVGPGEVGGLRLSISVLSERAPCPDPRRVEVGRHGVQIALGGRRAVFLPQVAPEQGWDRETLLGELCRKAQLPTDAWRAPEARLSVFEATVFGEPGA